MLVPIIGPSCAGKSLLLKNLQATLPELQPLESVTTRPRRASDTTPGEYLFVDEAEFERMSQAGEFLWAVHPHGLSYRYATRKRMVEQVLRHGLYAPILVVEVLQKLYDFAGERGLRDQVRPIYLHISDEAELRRRFKERGDTNPADIERRVLNAQKENAEASALAGLYTIDATQTPEEILAAAVGFLKQ